MSITLGNDETAVVFGEDVAFGGVFRCSLGLAEEFGRERVFNTPLTEQGIAGFGIGLSSMGQTAIAECQFADYMGPMFDQLANEAAKFRYRSNGQFSAGNLTVRAPCAAVGHGGLYHSQSPEAFYAVPGLKVVVPRSPLQAKGLLLASIRDPNPVVFFEPKILYRTASEHVPVESFTLPLGKAEILQEGSDLTIVSYGPPLYTIARALDALKTNPLIPASIRNKPPSIELIDLRTVFPADMETISESVRKTGRLIIVHEASRSGSISAEIAAEITEREFLRLEAPVKRVTGWDTPFPAAFEKFFLPDEIRVLDAIVETLQY
ncbi:thiamine diphosphate-binding protein [Atractiella rhizophila]|nr:thiamine diphosphate-binding protein [Atractiella rhizophila]